MSTTPPISILIVDDSEIVRVGLKTLLILNAETVGRSLRVVGEAHTLATAVSEAIRLKPDVVLLDIRLPDGSGMTACRQIIVAEPDIRILILTAVIDDQLVHDAMSSGAHGYLLKEINTRGLCQAIVDVSQGKFILDPALTNRVLNYVRDGNGQTPKHDPFAILSVQEQRVLALVAEGKTNKEVAGDMGLSDKTVKNYLSRVFEKLKIKHRSQAAVMYLKNRPK